MSQAFGTLTEAIDVADCAEVFQLSLFNKDELRQLEADRRHWRIRVAELEEDIIKEPERMEKAYQVKADRLEPVGLVYLWPVSS